MSINLIINVPPGIKSISFTVAVSVTAGTSVDATHANGHHQATVHEQARETFPDSEPASDRVVTQQETTPQPETTQTEVTTQADFATQLDHTDAQSAEVRSADTRPPGNEDPAISRLRVRPPTHDDNGTQSAGQEETSAGTTAEANHGAGAVEGTEPEHQESSSSPELQYVTIFLHDMVENNSQEVKIGHDSVFEEVIARFAEDMGLPLDGYELVLNGETVDGDETAGVVSLV